MRPGPRTGAVLAALALTCTLAGCSDGEPAPEPAPVPPSSAAPSAPATSADVPDPAPDPDAVRYVALGDSYSAAPGVPETDPADGCFRSDSNYAHVLAETADLALTDVTCSGATSDEVVAEQVPALSADTDLVTVGTGGNDLGLFLRVLTSCLTVPAADGASGSGADGGPSLCAQVIRDEIEPSLAQIQAKMGTALDAVTEAAPDAQVVVVGYPALLPERGTCPDVVPVAAADYPLVGGLTRALSDALRTEAEARGLDFVDVFAASQGHDLCSEDPWVNGAQIAPDGTVPFHPLAVEQAAVAALIGDLL